MKISARNTLPGTIRKIEPGAVNAEVTIELAPALTVVSVITLDAVKSLHDAQMARPGNATEINQRLRRFLQQKKSG